MSILGFKLTDKVLLLRLIVPVSGYFLVAAVFAWGSVVKCAKVHHALLAAANPLLGDERLYEALVPASVATRQTVITDAVSTEYNRERSSLTDAVTAIPNIIIDFFIPLVLLAFAAHLSFLSFVNTPFDIWEALSLLITLVLVIFAVSMAVVEFGEITEL